MGEQRVLLSRETLVSAIGDRWPHSDLAEAADLLAQSEGKFRPAKIGRLPTALIRAVQRERMLAAMHRAIAELGYPAVRVQDILDGAGVSRPTFYEQFNNKDDCFLSAFDSAAKRLRESIGAASEGGEDWREQIRLGLEALLRFIAAEPDAAATLIVESRGAGPVGAVRHDDLLEHFARCIDATVSRELSDASSEIAADGVVGGIASVLHTRIAKKELDDLDSLVPSLMYFVVLPYGGHKAATEEMRAR